MKFRQVAEEPQRKMSEATQKEQLDGAPANEQEAAVAPVIAEIASGLKSRLLRKVEHFDLCICQHFPQF
eukprot:m.491999 g.491999  ORF g.491999 m.491999 type:complete len:69 (+) comp111178_c0_seq1:94-300(+)